MQAAGRLLLSVLTAAVMGLTGCGGGGGGSDEPKVSPQSTDGYWVGSYQTGATKQNALIATRSSQVAYVFKDTGAVDVVYSALLPPTSDGTDSTSYSSSFVYANSAGGLQMIGKASSHVPSIKPGASMTVLTDTWNWNGVSPEPSSPTPDITGTFAMTEVAKADYLITLAELVGEYQAYADNTLRFDSSIVDFAIDTAGKVTGKFANDCTLDMTLQIGNDVGRGVSVGGGLNCDGTYSGYTGLVTPVFSSGGRVGELLVTLFDNATLVHPVLIHVTRRAASE
ncbi:MAG: hypothetical protein QM702_03305 [Rubrivivax sp.]